jgi:acetyl esterase/lipase
MSLRGEILCFALRRLCKAPDGVPPEPTVIRQRLALAKWTIPKPPKGTMVSRVIAGGVPCIRVSTPLSGDRRHILYLHGGAYVFGSPSLYGDFMWRIADATRAHVLCLDYRLAPEHPFPAAVDDAVSTYRWLLAEGADPGRTAIMGDSAGGGLSFATLLRLRDEGVALPAVAVAMSPWTDLTMSNGSVRRNAALDPMLNADHTHTFAGWYLNGADPRHPHASPLYGDPTGLPPSLIFVGHDEILYDDAALMADRLRGAGCSAELEVGPRMPHVWPLFARVLPEGRAAVARIGAFVQQQMAEK